MINAAFCGVRANEPTKNGRKKMQERKREREKERKGERGKGEKGERGKRNAKSKSSKTTTSNDQHPLQNSKAP